MKDGAAPMTMSVPSLAFSGFAVGFAVAGGGGRLYPPLMDLLPPRSEMERAFLASDVAYDGLFFSAVRTTGIFCLP